MQKMCFYFTEFKKSCVHFILKIPEQIGELKLLFYFLKIFLQFCFFVEKKKKKEFYWTVLLPVNQPTQLLSSIEDICFWIASSDSFKLVY